MKDFLSLGPTPCNENCVQFGADNYSSKSYKECSSYKSQLKRQFGEPPAGARFGLKNFPYEDGHYTEVVCHFNDEYPESVDFAFKVENNLPSNWDKESLDELNKKELMDEPSIEELEGYLADGICPAQDGCIVEPDGTCPHGYKSWLLVNGLI